MNIVYGYKWNQEFVDEDKKQVTKNTWCYVLKDFTTKQIEQGVKTLLSTNNPHKTWPPTVLEFAEFCKPRGYDAKPEVIKLENKAPLTPEEIKKFIDSIINFPYLNIERKKRLLIKYIGESEIEELLCTKQFI